jgi:hypothetical protein
MVRSAATPRVSNHGLVAMDNKKFLALALRNPVNEAIANELVRLALSDAWLVSGCLVQTVWNVQTGRDVDYASTTTIFSISIPTRHGRPKMP